MKRRWTGRAGRLALASAIVLFAAVTLRESARGRGYDLAPLPAAGHLVATGQTAHLYVQDEDHYNFVGDAVFRRAAAEIGFAFEPTPFVYPPLVAVLMQPVARVPFGVVERSWAIVSVALLLTGFYLTLAAYAPEWQRAWVWAVGLVAMCRFEPVLYGFWLGQTTAIIFPLFAAAVLLQRRGRYAAAGGALAVAAFIKLTPLVLAGVWLWRGPRRACAWFAGWLAVLWAVSLAVAGPAVHADYIQRVLAIGKRLTVAYNNHSLLAFLARSEHDAEAWFNWRLYEPDGLLVFLSAAVALAVAAATWAIVRRSSPDDEVTRAGVEGLAMLCMLLVPGVSWTHYFVFLLPPVIVVIRHSPDESLAARLAALLAFALCCRPLIPVQYAPDVTASAARIGAPTIAAALLAGVVLWVLKERAAPPAVERAWT